MPAHAKQQSAGANPAALWVLELGFALAWGCYKGKVLPGHRPGRILMAISHDPGRMGPRGLLGGFGMTARPSQVKKTEACYELGLNQFFTGKLPSTRALIYPAVRELEPSCYHAYWAQIPFAVDGTQ